MFAFLKLQKHAPNSSLNKFQAYQRVPGASETDKPTWDTAVQYCNSLGMDLATVADDDEYAVLREYVKQYDRCMLKGKEVGTSMLIENGNEVTVVFHLSAVFWVTRIFKSFL